ncbi:hypothetical protein EK21DRAFT_105377 [Setomelanomma holmii]|uniref:Uncharacterized protein n=1 Tax=Setomelanomma holmii TaxID=210430 RepID=A0A9P4GXL1_9PLEO|nr:hypothetical protein EK21DRAFT_105377 [Setomelanomma holmii]
MQAPHSDLEVVHDAVGPGVQKYAHHAADAPEPYQHRDEDTNKVAYTTYTQSEPPRSSTICGLRRRTFWILVMVAIIIVAAAVGGGVGGALASKASDNSNKTANTANTGSNTAQSSSQAPQSSSLTPTSTSTEPSTTVTTTSIVGPTSTLLRDCPSSNYTLYDVTLGSTTMSFRKACGISFLNVNGIDNAFGTPVASLNDCINMCAAYNINNKTEIQAGSSRICNSVCWRNTFDKINDWPGGMCFGFASQNSSGTFRYRLPAETRCDSAALINQEY